MGIYKDFALIATGLAIGTYIAKSDESNVVVQEYNKIIYKLKPIVRDIKDNIIEFFESNNVNFNFEDIRINVENTIDILKDKVSNLSEIQDVGEKMEFIKDEILHLLNSITQAFNSQKEILEETKVVIIDDSNEED